MYFDETEAEQILRQTVRDFAHKEIAPYAREWDEEETLPDGADPQAGRARSLGHEARPRSSAAPA